MVDHASIDHTGITGVGGSLGTWTDYTPTWGASTTPPTLGSTTILGRYKALDSKTYAINIWILITTGGAWNAGSGTYTFSLPAGLTTPNTTNRNQLLSAWVQDSGTTNFVCVARCVANSTKIDEVEVGDGTNPRVLTHNAPITWATGDLISISGIIEVQ